MSEAIRTHLDKPYLSELASLLQAAVIQFRFFDTTKLSKLLEQVLEQSEMTVPDIAKMALLEDEVSYQLKPSFPTLHSNLKWMAVRYPQNLETEYALD